MTHNTQYCELYTSSKEILANWYNNLKNISILTTFHNDYSTIKLLGKGNFARVIINLITLYSIIKILLHKSIFKVYYSRSKVSA